MSGQVKAGFLQATGSALNVSCGFIPDHVQVTNLTDGDSITIGTCKTVATYTAGGAVNFTELKSGDKVVGVSSGATGVVLEVLPLTSGAWSAGTAAGTFTMSPDSIVGTFTDGEFVYVNGQTAGNDINLASGFPAQLSVAIVGSVASVTGDSAITAYSGSTTAGKGFTLGATVSETGDLLHYLAIAND